MGIFSKIKKKVKGAVKKTVSTAKKTVSKVKKVFTPKAKPTPVTPQSSKGKTNLLKDAKLNKPTPSQETFGTSQTQGRSEQPPTPIERFRKQQETGEKVSQFGLAALPGGTGRTTAYSVSDEIIGAFTKSGTKTVTDLFKSVKPGKVGVNTKTVEQSTNLIKKAIGIGKKKPIIILGAIGSIIGTYPWAEWAFGEAKEGMQFSAKKAMDTGDPEVIKEFMEISDEIFDVTIWDNLARLTPGVNIGFGFSEKAKALDAQKKVNDKILADEIIKIETGETDEDTYKRNQDEKFENDKFLINFYNEQRIINDQRIRDADIEGRNEDAAFWRKEKADERKREAEDRQAIADFWSAYHIEKAKIQESNRPSNLNFGLL